MAYTGGFNVLIIGSTGTGKSTAAKQLYQAFGKGMNRQLYAYDLNGEWGFNPSQIGTFDQWLEIISPLGNPAEGVKNAFIMFEEATQYLTHGMNPMQVKNITGRARHTKNVNVFNYLSVHSVPAYVLDQTHWLILKPTGENPELVINRYKNYTKLINAYNYVNSESDKYRKVYLQLQDKIRTGRHTEKDYKLYKAAESKMRHVEKVEILVDIGFF